MDVVDAGDHDDWTFPPFELTDKDGKLFGRGTTDMKGGLMAMVIAMIELKQSNALKARYDTFISYYRRRNGTIWCTITC